MKVNVLSKDDLTAPEKAVEIIRKVASRISGESMAYIHPDCGLRRTKLDLAFLILKNLVNVSKIFNTR